MNKSKAIFASMALMAVAMAPLALAHDNDTDWALNGTGGLNLPSSSANTDRVSGVYYKDVSALVGHVGPVVADNDTSFLLGAANALCDMEVLSDGSAKGSPLDEPEVDGADPAGTFPTTLFNDGGVGAACHTHTGYYLEGDYNTAGCTYDPAFAADAAGDVWITTVCDYGQSTEGIGLTTYLLSCANSVLTGEPLEFVDCAALVAGCFVTIPGGGCPLNGGGFLCGADENGSGGLQTAGQSGWGSDGVAFDPVPALTDDENTVCSDGDGAAAVFVWTAVFIDSTGALPAVTGTSVPTVGIIY